MRHLLKITDLTVPEIDELIDCATDIMTHPETYQDACKRKKLATLFFEPSTRTRLSFEAAMIELGGQVIGFSSAGASSAVKGESIADTIEMINSYADMIAMRHPAEGGAAVAIQHAKVPFINAGDGGHHHPTQTLADLMTIKKRRLRLEGLTIGVCGDLKYGRTVHSLLAAMSRYGGNRYVLVSPKELRLPDYVKAEIRAQGRVFNETESLEEVIPSLDILYMTRIQGERFADNAEYERLRDSFVLDAEKLQSAKKELCVMHPLPRVNEISTDVDNDPRACYFEQALNGKLMRMALILKLFSDLSAEDADRGQAGKIAGYACENAKCAIHQERGVDPLFLREGEHVRCAYCDAEAVTRQG